MKESPSRLEMYIAMAALTLLLMFSQHVYYLAVERLTVRIEAAVGANPKQQQQQQVIMPRQPHELEYELRRDALKGIQDRREQEQRQ